MEIKVTNLKTNETRKANMPQKTLLEIANKILNTYGYGSIVTEDYDKGILILNNNFAIEDVMEFINENYDYARILCGKCIY